MKGILITVLVFGSILNSAQIILIDGTKINGEIISSDDTELKIKVTYSEDLITVNRNQVLKINFEDFGGLNAGVNSPPNIVDFSSTARKIEQAGSNLVEFKSQYYTGFFIQVASIVLIFLAEDDEFLSIALIGSLAGSIMQLFSFSKVGAAGEDLEAAARELGRLKE